MLKIILISFIALPAALLAALAILRAGGWLTFRKSDAAIRAALVNTGAILDFHETDPGSPGSVSYLSARRGGAGGQLDLAILFVHGSPGSKDAFLRYLGDEALLSRAVLYAMDRPGFGYSCFGTPVHSLREQAVKLMEVVDRVPEQRVLLVGHSFGCGVIARAAMDDPGKISGLHLIAGTIAPEAEPNNWWRKIVDHPLISGILPVSLATCNREMLPLREELEKMLPLWEKITCPVTLIHGTSDWIVSFRNLPLTRDRLIHASKLRTRTLAGAGHMMLWTMPDEMAAEILKTAEMVEPGTGAVR